MLYEVKATSTVNWIAPPSATARRLVAPSHAPTADGAGMPDLVCLGLIGSVARRLCGHAVAGVLLAMTGQPATPPAGHRGADRPAPFSRREVSVQNTPAPITRLPGKRILAFVIDGGCALAWAAITAAVGVPLDVTGVTHLVDPVALNISAAAVVVVPVTVGLAWFESRSGEGTLGKRAGQLAVVTAIGRSRINFARALGRNVGKVMVPWLVGHAAVFSIVAASTRGAIPISVGVLTGLSYVLPIVYVVSLFVGIGHTPYDLLAGTIVIHRPAS